ncbi:hypothetical protein HWV62_10152 [Athelia sp. TMB]|nr:hypothetical protein HWV62_10152 [Athelia sp. TMB]
MKELEASLLFLMEVLSKHKFEAIFGFSQGALLAEQVASMLERPELYPSFFDVCKVLPEPLRFVVAVSGFLARGECSSWETSPSIDSLQDSTLFIETPVLHVIGRTDVIVVRERSEVLINFSKNSRIEEHAGGHAIPTRPRWRKFFAAFFRNPFGHITSPSIPTLQTDVHTGFLPRDSSLVIGKTLPALYTDTTDDDSSSAPSTPDSLPMTVLENPVELMTLPSAWNSSKNGDSSLGEPRLHFEDESGIGYIDA